MKKELFQFPIGLFFRFLGGVPIDRKVRGNMVHTLYQEFESRESFYLALTPEGTRKKVQIWKRGFYHIAKKANVPIVLAYMDYGKRRVGVGPIIYPGDNIEIDIQTIKEFYSGIQPKFPDRFNKV